jgi:broad specificity phosphatase PhoE
MGHQSFQEVQLSTIVGLLRHGQTDWNIDMRLQGISDIPLNQTGHEQAKIAAEILASQEWHRVVTSPLSRAKVTADYVSAKLGLEAAVVHELLLERSFGAAEGLSYEDWKERLQAGLHAEGAESIEDLEQRAFRLLDELADSYPDQRVIAVSHGALIRKLIGLVSLGEFPRDGERFGNASLTTIIHDGGQWKILDYNPATLSF